MDNDFDTLNPTEADLALAEQEVFDAAEAAEDDDLDFDSNYADDRYDRVGSNGMPAWSLFAN